MSSKILLVAENVTLAQVVRLVALGRRLGPEFQVHFACSEFDPLVFDDTPFIRHTLLTAPKDKLFRAMEQGKPLYDKRTLRDYVRADVELLERVRPDLVVGDFRMTLSSAAQLVQIPCATLINAYFSPFAQRDSYPVPDHPILNWLGEEMTAKYFPIALPRVFAHFTAPLNAVRAELGLLKLSGMLEMLTHGDFTLYPDDPRLTPVDALPATHWMLGPVLWSPNVALPAAIAERVATRPLIYITLGSSGRTSAMQPLLEAVSTLDIDAVVATAGRVNLATLPINVQCYEFVPGDELTRRAAAVVCNGGSTSGYQALAAGKPVLALPSNFDQFLATQAMVNAGAALEVKARTATPEALRSALQRLLADPALTVAAQRVATWFAEHDAYDNFRHFVRQACAPTRDNHASLRANTSHR
jgi:UDP:flavonoid glycosyltransferase YjiC (YdhE family)